MHKVTSPLVVALAVALSFAAHAEGVEPGQPAPDFTLKDLDGKSFHLTDYKGKTVVLEWANPECPYYVKSHTRGSLVGLAKKYTSKGVVWAAINSAAPGKQGYGVEKNKEAQKKWGIEHPILTDETGNVGHSYGATNTPHMYVIGKDGKVAYKGAIDNSPDGEKEHPTGGVLINYVDQAMEDLAAGHPLRTASTKAYGCSVKYAPKNPVL